jgi:hypothetical protein
MQTLLSSGAVSSAQVHCSCKQRTSHAWQATHLQQAGNPSERLPKGSASRVSSFAAGARQFPQATQLDARTLLQFERAGHVTLRGLLQPCAETLPQARADVDAIVSRKTLQALRHRCAAAAKPAVLRSSTTCSEVLRMASCQLPASRHNTRAAICISEVYDFAGDSAVMQCRVRVLRPDLPAGAVAQMSQGAARAALQQADEEIGFLQFFHLRRESEAIACIAHGAAIVDAACALLGSRRIRVYQVLPTQCRESHRLGTSMP